MLKQLAQKLNYLCVSEKGFTLIEIIIGLVLLGILSYVAVVEFSSSSSSLKEKTLAQKIISDVRYAQEMALNHRQEVKFLVEPTNNRYTIRWQDNTYLKTPVGGQNFIFDINTSEFKGINLTSTGFLAGLLIFNSKGQPLNNHDLITSDRTLLSLNNSVFIKIVPGTGSCYIQE